MGICSLHGPLSGSNGQNAVIKVCPAEYAQSEASKASKVRKCIERAILRWLRKMGVLEKTEDNSCHIMLHLLSW